MRTITRTDPNKVSLIRKLRTKSKEANCKIWATIASEMARPRRQRVEINLSRLNGISDAGDIVVVPGRVLGSGHMDQKISIAADDFSESAKQKLIESGSTIYSIEELIDKFPKGSNIRIIK